MDIDSFNLVDKKVVNIKQQDLIKEGKRYKWQLPPSHISVFSTNPTSKLKNSSHRIERSKSDMMEGQNNQNSINVVSLEEMVEAISAPKLSRL
jgi:hypothetical protein